MVLGIRVIFIGKEIFFLKYFCDFTFIVYWRYMFYGIIFSFKGGQEKCFQFSIIYFLFLWWNLSSGVKWVLNQKIKSVCYRFYKERKIFKNIDYISGEIMDQSLGSMDIKKGIGNRNNNFEIIVFYNYIFWREVGIFCWVFIIFFMIIIIISIIYYVIVL